MQWCRWIRSLSRRKVWNRTLKLSTSLKGPFCTWKRLWFLFPFRKLASTLAVFTCSSANLETIELRSICLTLKLFAPSWFWTSSQAWCQNRGATSHLIESRKWSIVLRQVLSMTSQPLPEMQVELCSGANHWIRRKMTGKWKEFSLIGGASWQPLPSERVLCQLKQTKRLCLVK